MSIGNAVLWFSYGPGCRTIFTWIYYVETKDLKQTYRRRAGGLKELVDSWWFNPGQVTVEEHLCAPDIELWVTSFRPCCLWRTFTCVILILHVMSLTQATSTFSAFMEVFADLSLSSFSDTFAKTVPEETRQPQTITLLPPCFTVGLWSQSKKKKHPHVGIYCCQTARFLVQLG